MGMTLMIIGVLCFVIGFVIYSSPKRAIETEKVSNPKIVNNKLSVTDTSNLPIKPSHSSYSANELEKIIDMAIADGVLTNNERNLIKDFANSRGLNYTVIIHDIEKRIAKSGSIAETEIIDINRKQGYDFEKFVVGKFNNRFIKVKEWAGDKYVNGTYAETTQHPDLLLELDLKNKKSQFAVECKWRSRLYNKGVEFASPEQFKRYQVFEDTKEVPVFIAIGIGGSGANPEELFVIPLSKIKSNFISINQLKKYTKKMDTDFFYDSQKQTLR